MKEINISKPSFLVSKLLEIRPEKSHFQILSSGRLVAKQPYNNGALKEHLLMHTLYGLTIEELPEELRWLFPRIPKTSHCNPVCASRPFGHRKNPDTESKMRGRISSATVRFLKPDLLFTNKQFGKHGELEEFWFRDETSEIDVMWSFRQFEVSREKKEKHLKEQAAILFGSEPEPESRGGAGFGDAATL
jgi:hypothetical protein